MVVADSEEEAAKMLAAQKPTTIQEWKLSEFAGFDIPEATEKIVMRGMGAFMKANCNQCHVLAGHGVNLGPDLTDVTKRYKGNRLLQQLLEPSSEINEKYQTFKFLLNDGRVVSGVIANESKGHFDVMTNLLTPKQLTRVKKGDIEQQVKSKVSAMPAGLLDVLTQEEIRDLLSFLQSSGFQMPDHLKDLHNHNHNHKHKPEAGK